MAVTILLGLQPDNKIVFQIMENDKALAHAIFDKDQAMKISNDIKNLAEKINKGVI